MLLSTTLVAQKEKTRYTMKAYIPVQFEAGNYQMGTYTWGRWDVPGIELGLNLKKRRFEQEFILGSPSISRETFYKFPPGGSNSDYYQENHIHTHIGIRYQAGYEVWKGSKEKFRIVPGLGLAWNGGFNKTVSYESGYGYITDKSQGQAFRPYLHTSFNYAFNTRWGMDMTLMYSPTAVYLVRIKNFYPSGSSRVFSASWTSDEVASTIFSRIGVSYKF